MRKYIHKKKATIKHQLQQSINLIQNIIGFDQNSSQILNFNPEEESAKDNLFQISNSSTFEMNQIHDLYQKRDTFRKDFSHKRLYDLIQENKVKSDTNHQNINLAYKKKRRVSVIDNFTESYNSRKRQSVSDNKHYENNYEKQTNQDEKREQKMNTPLIQFPYFEHHQRQQQNNDFDYTNIFIKAKLPQNLVSFMRKKNLYYSKQTSPLDYQQNYPVKQLQNKNTSLKSSRVESQSNKSHKSMKRQESSVEMVRPSSKLFKAFSLELCRKKMISPQLQEKQERIAQYFKSNVINSTLKKRL